MIGEPQRPRRLATGEERAGKVPLTRPSPASPAEGGPRAGAFSLPGARPRPSTAQRRGLERVSLDGPREAMKRILRSASIVLLAATFLAAYAALVVGTGQRATSPAPKARRSHLTPAAVETLAMYSDRSPPAPVEPVRRPGRDTGLNRDWFPGAPTNQAGISHRGQLFHSRPRDRPGLSHVWVRPGHPDLRAFCAKLRATDGGLPPEHPRFWLRHCLLEEGFDPCTREGRGPT